MEIKVIKGSPSDREIAAIVAAVTLLKTKPVEEPVRTSEWARPQLRQRLASSWRNGALR